MSCEGRINCIEFDRMLISPVFQVADRVPVMLTLPFRTVPECGRAGSTAGSTAVDEQFRGPQVSTEGHHRTHAIPSHHRCTQTGKTLNGSIPIGLLTCALAAGDVSHCQRFGKG